MADLTAFLSQVASVLAVLVMLFLAGVMYRMLRGPDVADRFVALDMLTGLVVALLAIVSIMYGRREFLDVGLGVAAFSFVGTVAVGVFLQRHRGRKR